MRLSDFRIGVVQIQTKWQPLCINHVIRLRRREFSVNNQYYYSGHTTQTIKHSHTSQILGLIGLASSVLVVLAGLLYSHSVTESPDCNETLSNARIVKMSKPCLKHFSSFYTQKPVHDNVNLKLAASVVAETIPRSALKQRYSFIRTLDDGAFGRVFKAIDKLTSKEVAIKVVPHNNMSPDQVYNEVEVLRRVRGHENIVHLFQVLNCDNKYFLISELCTGGELLDVLTNWTIFDEKKASVLTEKLASALHHIHKCGFAHCDLKPENIVFSDKKYEEVNCKIIDFGVAHELNAGNFQLTEESVASCVGTLAYSPPEILHAAENGSVSGYKYDLTNYDLRKIDTWALGIVLYICLFGCHPFDVKGEGLEDALIKRVLDNDYSFEVHGAEFKISESAKSLIRGLLCPDPNQRLSTEDVLSHEWVKPLTNHEYLSRLPTSWVSNGFVGGRSKDEESALKHERFNDFLTERATDAFVRSLLIAAVLNSNSKDEVSLSSSKFLSQAFGILDKEGKGLITLDNIETILQQTSSVKTIVEPSLSLSMINKKEFEMILRHHGCVSRTLEKNDRLFTQGAEPQGFYILTKGKCALEFDNRVFFLSHPGALFGESALDQGLSQRAVTIRAIEPSEVTYIPKNIFFRALAGTFALQTKLFEAARLQQAGRIRGLIERLLAERGEKLEKKYYKRGEFLYNIGGKPVELFFIENGLVSALAQTLDKKDFSEGLLTMGIAQRGKGDLTGSSIFFKDGKRYCSVQCLTDVEASVLNLEQLESLLESNRTLQFYLASQAHWRMEQWKLRLADAERGLTEQQLLPILLLQCNEDKQLSEKNPSTITNSVKNYAKAVKEMNSKMYMTDEIVFKKGDASKQFYLLSSGSAVAELETKQGDTMVVAQFEPGDHFGVASLLNHRKYHATTVRCVVPCEVLSMSKSDFFDLIGNDDTSFAEAVGKAIRIRRHRWTKNILVLARNDADEETKVPSLLGVKNTVFKKDTQKVLIERVELKKGEKLFLRGEPANAVYYVHSGELRHLPRNPNQDKNNGLPQHVFQPGDALGLDSLGDDNYRSRTCYCSTGRCIISKIPKNTVENLIRQHEYVSENLKRHFDRVAPLRELEHNLDKDNDSENMNRRNLHNFFSNLNEKPEELNPERKRVAASNLSFSQVMEEISK